MWGGMPGDLNLIKLCVGAENVEALADWQRRNQASGAAPVHVTRMWPTRAAELLDGGSLYWVFKGFALARQRILGLDAREGADGVRRCALVLSPDIVRTAAQSRRAFQGWRYLAAADAPRDLAAGAGHVDLPPALIAQLDAIGVL